MTIPQSPITIRDRQNLNGTTERDYVDGEGLKIPDPVAEELFALRQYHKDTEARIEHASREAHGESALCCQLREQLLSENTFLVAGNERMGKDSQQQDTARLNWLITKGTIKFFKDLSEYPASARQAIDAAMQKDSQ